MTAAVRRKAIAIGTAVLFIAAAVFLLSQIRAPAKEEVPRGGDITVSVEITCGNVLEKGNYEKLSQSVKDSGLLDGGNVLAQQKVALKSGAPAMDALKIVCEENGLSLDIEKAAVNGMTDYVYGIGGLCEGDCTRRSGWVYYVDGVEPDTGLEDCPLTADSSLKLEFIRY